MRVGTAGALAATIWTLAACDRQPGNTTAPAADVATGANASGDVDAYLRRFAAGNADDCFGPAERVSATFRSRDAAAPAPAVTRVIVAVDASGSMASRVTGRRKMDLARVAASAFVDRLPTQAEAGLLVFGQAGDNSARGKPRSCGSIELAVPLTRDRGALTGAVSRIAPVGWTPLAAALTRAEGLLDATEAPGEQVIYVVSDGQETCGGDPVAVARSINRGRTRAVVNIIGFAVPTGEAATLAAVAAAGGGRFVNATSGDEVDAVAARIREEGRQAANTIAESGATARNTISASGTVARARICVGGLAARERIAVGADIAKKRMAAQDVAVEERAERVLGQRHAALERRVADFERRVDSGRDAANDRIRTDAATVVK